MTELIQEEDDDAVAQEHREIEAVTQQQLLAITQKAIADRDRVDSRMTSDVRFDIGVDAKDNVNINDKKLVEAKVRGAYVKINDNRIVSDVKAGSGISLDTIRDKIMSLKNTEMRGYAKQAYNRIRKKLAQEFVKVFEIEK